MSAPDCQDDPTIPDDARLFRRVHPNHVVKDENTGLCRISSAVFDDLDLSVDIESVLRELGKTPEHCLIQHPQHKLVAVLADAARGLGLTICSKPTEENPAHGLVYGKKSKTIKYKLIDAARWVIPTQAPVPRNGACN